MDYRHPEDFAREMERAALRAHAARDAAIDEWFRAAGRALLAAWRRVARSSRAERIVTEA